LKPRSRWYLLSCRAQDVKTNLTHFGTEEEVRRSRGEEKEGGKEQASATAEERGRKELWIFTLNE